MIYDKTSNWQNYFPKNKIWQKVFAFVKKCSVDIEPGRYAIAGEDAYASVFSYATKPPKEGVYEAHRKQIDVQLLLKGRELVYATDIDGLAVKTEYNEAKDCILFNDPERLPGAAPLTEGFFAVFFPNDAHMPSLNYGASSENVKKIVVKINTALLP
ncbi:MAG: YhcH/YjgK/YiaL family protein [Verrucomicrobiota bacterium]